MLDCVFCKIVKGKLPCYKIYEDKNFLAFLDIRPLNPGHTLVIPKKHYRWVWDVPNIESYYKVVKRIANAIRKAMKTDWIISLVIGEAVPHAHVWLVPRFENDNHPKGWLDLENVKKITEKEMQEIAEKIKKKL
ncbi:MAG: HIT domain-containing protein [Candidatus Pacearchaeota archaeon]